MPISKSDLNSQNDLQRGLVSGTNFDAETGLEIIRQFSKQEINSFIPFTKFFSGHLQTLAGHFIPSENFKHFLQSEILNLSDGDQIDLEYVDNKARWTFILMHGLGGDSKSDYIRRAGNIGLELRMNIICVNHRGASSRAFSKKSYHSGRGEDAESVILWARKKFQGSKIVAIGFSLSGAIMLNLLTQRYGVQGPDYAIVVNAPLNLFDSSKKLSQGFSKIYDWRFYLNLKKILKAKHQEASQWPYLQKVEYIDEHYTSRVNGFENAEDYYLKCSPVKYLHQIKIPTFVLTSEDDPFVSVEFYRSAQWSDWVHLHVAPSGGHMGYIAKNKIEKFGCRWMDYYISRVLIYLQGFDR